MRPLPGLLLSLLLLAPGSAGALVVSTSAGEILDGQPFQDGDVLHVDATPGSAARVLGEAIFDDDENVDAAALLPNGNLALSIADNLGATIGGVFVEDGDVFEYDAASGAVTPLVAESRFGTNVDVDAVHVLPNGHLLLSFRQDELLGATLVRNGDVIDLDPSDGSFSFFLSEDIFADDADIDGVSVRDDGMILLSTTQTESIGTLVFDDASVVAYDPPSGQATLVLALDPRIVSNADVDAVAWVGTPLCADGFDNDGDGLADFPDDPGCQAADDGSEREASLGCDDGADGDDDGMADFPADPGCLDLEWIENPECQDGLHNDIDGKLDFDGGLSIYGPGAPELTEPDPQCVDKPWKRRERRNGCGLGFELAFLLGPWLWLARRRERGARGA